ncbi:uncharacterized protein LOC107268052 isoform X2 [Cephus cinctus]|nr:uncharacterized protein LOC107268052 isoform X2 [Cephus cinctus]
MPKLNLEYCSRWIETESINRGYYLRRVQIEMRKSPLSAPSGSGRREGFGWNSRESCNRTGYGRVKNDNYQCFTPNQNQSPHQKGSDDFIPLGFSSPLCSQQRRSNDWYGSGGDRNHRNSGGYNRYKNNFHGSSKSNLSCSPSPYKNQSTQRHNKNFQKGIHRQINISTYVNLESFLEDPWADLTKNLQSLESDNQLSEKCSANVGSNCSDVVRTDASYIPLNLPETELNQDMSTVTEEKNQSCTKLNPESI